MVTLHNFRKISDFEWEIPRSYRADMRVPVRVFATRELLEETLDDLSMEQAVNASTLPGIVGTVVVMPDMHQGYGFPIGGVAATRYPDGVISPGAIGYDINCGVRLLGSSIRFEEARTLSGSSGQCTGPFLPEWGGNQRGDKFFRSGTGPGLPPGLTLGFKEGDGIRTGFAPDGRGRDVGRG